MKPCCVCAAAWEEAKMTKVVLTEVERAYVRAVQGEDTEQYLYCPPCWGLLNQKAQAAALVRGVTEMQLRQAGRSDAREVADKLHAFLLSRGGQSVS